MEGWTIEKFSDVVVYTKKPKGLKESFPIPFVAMNLVPFDKMEINSFELIDKLKSGTYVEDGDILLAKITPSFENGKQGILRIGKKYAKKDDIRTELAEKMDGSTGRQRLSKSVLDNLPINLPPLQEQHKIAHVLTTVQKAIEQQDNLIRTTTELKKALIQKLFIEGTIGEPQKETEVGLVPESWKVVKIETLIQKTKISDPGKEPEKEFIYVDVSSVSNESFRIETTSKILGKEAPSRARKLIQDGAVIFATVRPTLKCIAKISQDYHNQICSTGYCVIKPDPDKLIQEYLYQYLQTDFFIEKIEKLQRGASYPAVRDTDVKGMYIPIPKLSEQKEIGRTLNILDQRNNILIGKKQTLTSLFKTLLHELMTGQRRVHELEFKEDLTL